MATVDPTYGDDLWAAGFSSDEGEEQRPSGPGSSDLDLLASLVEEGGGAGRGEERGSQGGQQKTSTFEESLMKPDEVALMKAKMQDMEKELQRLKQQISGTKRPHPQCNVHQARTRNSTSHQPPANDSDTAKRPPRKPPPSAMDSISNSSVTSSRNVREGAANPPPPVRDRTIADELVAQRKSDQENNVTTDVFSGIRIKNPLVSSQLMKKRMQGRKMIKIPNISSRVKGTDIEGDWVTVGVVVDKLPPKESVKGNKYAVWKLSDLSGQSAVVALFLFGKAYQEHWKMAQGSVVALLNPSVMPDRETGAVETGSKQRALSLDLAQKLMPLGVSQDFTVCRANTKTGRKCTNFAKSSDGGFCDYHIQGAYNKMRTGRMECQGGYGPSSTNIRGKLFKNSKTDLFYYGGQSYTSGSGSSGGRGGRGSGGNSNVGGEQDRRLFAPGVRASVVKVSHELKDRKAERVKSTGCPLPRGRRVTTSEGGDLFKQMLGSQSAGARLLSKHLEREEAKKQQAIRLPEKSASELLKEGKGLSKKQSSQETSDEDQSSKPVKHAGPVLEPESSFSDNSAVFSSRKRQSAGMNDQGTETDSFPLTNSSKLLPPPHKKKPQLRELERDVCQRSGSNSMSPFQPRLGRGLVPGSVLDLVSSHSPSSLSQRRQSATKLKAVAILRQKQNESSTDDILYRVEENRADTAHHLPAEGVSREEEEEQGPLSKRRKLDPAEVEMILNAKSSHEWAAREVEWEKEEQYFSQHEKKENMEQRLSSITELHVYVSQCKQCNYVAEQPSDLCRKEAHRLTRYKAVKRWFECQECRERCCAYNARYPPLACRKCNGQVYKQTSMFRERKGPKVGAENLLLRGREEKFLN